MRARAAMGARRGATRAHNTRRFGCTLFGCRRHRRRYHRHRLYHHRCHRRCHHEGGLAHGALGDELARFGPVANVWLAPSLEPADGARSRHRGFGKALFAERAAAARALARGALGGAAPREALAAAAAAPYLDLLKRSSRRALAAIASAPGARGDDGAVAARREAAPVSYTHLTLPTKA